MATVTVKPGDTLWGLAGTHLKDNLRWPEFYQQNAETIRAEQKKHKFRPTCDDQEYWIFPDTVLQIPATP